MKIKQGKEKDYAKYLDVNIEPASKKVVEFVETWTSLMENELEQGKELSEIILPCRKKANPDTIDVVQYSYACMAISHFWEHGEAFRQWHNLSEELQNEGQIANETGGIINPALINMAQEKCKVVRTNREIINNRLLQSLKDDDKVAIVIGKDDLDLLIGALECYPPPAPHAYRMEQDLIQLKKEAFGC